MQGIKRKRRCESDCKEHIFSLHNHKGHSKYEIKLSFCPKYQREPLKPQQTYPEYNDDQKYYTSAFILGVDKRIMAKNDQQEQMDHQKQIRESLEKHNQLCFPRPNSKHSLCSVCKQHYKNYYFHIASEEHREKIHMNAYNDHIGGLCSLYKELWEGAQQKADEEQERLEQQMLLAGSDDEKSYFRSDAEMPRPKNSNDSQVDMDRLGDQEKNIEQKQIEPIPNHLTVIKSVDKMFRKIEKEKNQYSTKIITMKALTKRFPAIPAPLLYEQIKKKNIKKEDKQNEKQQIQKERDAQIERFKEKEVSKQREEQNEVNWQKEKQDQQKQQQIQKNKSIQRLKLKKREDINEDDSEQKHERSRSLTHRQERYTATKQQGEFIWKRQEHKPLPNAYSHTTTQKQRIGINQREMERRDYYDNSNTVPHHRYPPNYYPNYHSYDNHRNQERDHYNEKAKIPHDKAYEYNMMYYNPQPWNYSNPYYPIGHPHQISHQPPIDAPKTSTVGNGNVNGPPPPPPPNPYLTGTNININFPMYMPYSPHGMNYPMPPHSRYQMPVNPYVAYQYPPPPPPVTHYNERRDHQSSNKAKQAHGAAK